MVGGAVCGKSDLICHIDKLFKNVKRCRRESVILTSYSNKGNPVKQSCATRPVYIEERAKVSHSSNTCRRLRTHDQTPSYLHCPGNYIDALSATKNWAVERQRNAIWHFLFPSNTFVYSLKLDCSCKKKPITYSLTLRERDTFDRDQTLKQMVYVDRS